jgi:phospholipase D1/2
MKLTLESGVHYTAHAKVTESAVLVDARSYYRAFYWSALEAEQYLLIAGWQFDSDVALLRGEDAQGAPLPVTFLAFLDALCARRPQLRVYILAWDYSLIYALEREWMQALKFSVRTPDALRFEFDVHPSPGGSHHQKFLVVDGVLAFAGGLDICDARWDDRGHRPDDPLRADVSGALVRPNHEIQAGLRGPAAAALVELFRARWQRACSEELELPIVTASAASRLDLATLTGGAALLLGAEHVFLSTTDLRPDGEPVVQVRALYLDALRSAERLVYVETQYFTSRSIAAALVERLADPQKPKLTLLIMLPQGADNGKEKFALGETQNMVLAAVERAAKAGGHAIYLLCTVCGESTCATFIHSKLLIVDDEFLCVSSANFTERSMGLDTELAVAWHAAENPELCRQIARVRASLLAEHSGSREEELLSLDGLALTVDRLVQPGASNLRVCHYEPESGNPLKTWIFDPGGPLDLPEAFSSLESDGPTSVRS